MAAEPLPACCTCKLANADLQRKYGLKKCGTFGDGCNMWERKV